MDLVLEFACPDCGEILTDMDEDLDDPGIFFCLGCDWEGPARA